MTSNHAIDRDTFQRRFARRSVRVIADVSAHVSGVSVVGRKINSER